MASSRTISGSVNRPKNTTFARDPTPTRSVLNAMVAGRHLLSRSDGYSSLSAVTGLANAALAY